MTSEVLSVGIDEPAGEVLRLLAAYPVHHLPVLRGRQVVGMLSSADVMKLEGLLPRRDPKAFEDLTQRMTVAALVRRPPVTILAHQSVAEAAELMATNAVHALPVVDLQQSLLGIVTTTDIIAAALRDGVVAVAPGRGTAGATAAATDDQLVRGAVAAARAVVAEGGDPGDAARALLRVHQRVVELEQVLDAADRYVHAGQSQQLHTALLRAIALAKRDAPPAREIQRPLAM